MGLNGLVQFDSVLCRGREFVTNQAETDGVEWVYRQYRSMKLIDDDTKDYNVVKWE